MPVTARKADQVVPDRRIGAEPRLRVARDVVAEGCARAGESGRCRAQDVTLDQRVGDVPDEDVSGGVAGSESVDREAADRDVVGVDAEADTDSAGPLDLNLGTVELRQGSLVAGIRDAIRARPDGSPGSERDVVGVAAVGGLRRAVDGRPAAGDFRQRAGGSEDGDAVRQRAGGHAERDRVRRPRAVLRVEERLPERTGAGVGRIRDGERRRSQRDRGQANEQCSEYFQGLS